MSEMIRSSKRYPLIPCIVILGPTCAGKGSINERVSYSLSQNSTCKNRVLLSFGFGIAARARLKETPSEALSQFEEQCKKFPTDFCVGLFEYFAKKVYEEFTSENVFVGIDGFGIDQEQYNVINKYFEIVGVLIMECEDSLIEEEFRRRLKKGAESYKAENRRDSKFDENISTRVKNRIKMWRVAEPLIPKIYEKQAMNGKFKKVEYQERKTWREDRQRGVKALCDMLGVESFNKPDDIMIGFEPAFPYRFYMKKKRLNLYLLCLVCVFLVSFLLLYKLLL